VRELHNVMERLVVRTRTDLIGIEDLPIEIRQSRPQVSLAAPPAPERSVVDTCFDRMVNEKQSFWTVVYAPFMSRDLTRDQLRAIIARGLDMTSGSYRVLTQLFNIEADDYKRFLSLLKKHQCHMPFQQFRVPLKMESLDKSSSSPPARTLPHRVISKVILAGLLTGAMFGDADRNGVPDAAARTAVAQPASVDPAADAGEDFQRRVA
jgi:hypothetical protein